MTAKLRTSRPTSTRSTSTTTSLASGAFMRRKAQKAVEPPAPVKVKPVYVKNALKDDDIQVVHEPRLGVSIAYALHVGAVFFSMSFARKVGPCNNFKTSLIEAFSKAKGYNIATARLRNALAGNAASIGSIPYTGLVKVKSPKAIQSLTPRILGSEIKECLVDLIERHPLGSNYLSSHVSNDDQISNDTVMREVMRKISLHI